MGHVASRDSLEGKRRHSTGAEYIFWKQRAWGLLARPKGRPTGSVQYGHPSDRNRQFEQIKYYRALSDFLKLVEGEWSGLIESCGKSCYETANEEVFKCAVDPGHHFLDTFSLFLD